MFQYLTMTMILKTDLKGNSSIDLIYNKDGVWKSATGGDNADNLIHKRYTIKFVHDIKTYN